MAEQIIAAKADTTFLRNALLSVENKFRSDLAHKREINTHSPSFGPLSKSEWVAA